MPAVRETRCNQCDGRGYTKPVFLLSKDGHMHPVGTAPCSLCGGTGELTKFVGDEAKAGMGITPGV